MNDNATFAEINKETRPRRTNTVIVGAGAAGLAAAACLQKQGVPFVLLEKSNQVGSPWRNYYDRLHLHTDRSNSGLPHLPMPTHYPKYPSRTQVVEYLELYARHFGLEPEFGQAVVSATCRDGVWQTKSQAALYESPNLVVATGYTRVNHLFQSIRKRIEIFCTTQRTKIRSLPVSFSYRCRLRQTPSSNTLAPPS